MSRDTRPLPLLKTEPVPTNELGLTCTGGSEQASGKQLHYMNSPIHRIMPDGWIHRGATRSTRRISGAGWGTRHEEPGKFLNATLRKLPVRLRKATMAR